jgi:hypothetical protein
MSCITNPFNGRYDATVGVHNQAPGSWLGEIEVTHLSYEAVPLLRKPFFNEVVACQPDLFPCNAMLLVTEQQRITSVCVRAAALCTQRATCSMFACCACRSCFCTSHPGP